VRCCVKQAAELGEWHRRRNRGHKPRTVALVIAQPVDIDPVCAGIRRDFEENRLAYITLMSVANPRMLVSLRRRYTKHLRIARQAILRLDRVLGSRARSKRRKSYACVDKTYKVEIS